jgi:nucleotidyltransferase substrate binding protein (TIGR01987 family)
MSESNVELKQSIADLEHALTFENRAAKDRFFYAGIAKSFEICFEYTWKWFKRCAIDEGLEVHSPREAIKAAGRLDVIDDVEKWLGFLHDRNLAVHDYVGIADDVYLATIKEFLKEAKRCFDEKGSDPDY